MKTHRSETLSRETLRRLWMRSNEPDELAAINADFAAARRLVDQIIIHLYKVDASAERQQCERELRFIAIRSANVFLRRKRLASLSGEGRATAIAMTRAGAEKMREDLQRLARRMARI